METAELCTMDDAFTYYDGELKDFIAEASSTKETLLKRIISPVVETLVKDLRERGIIINSTYRHILDNSAIRHIIKTHGSLKENLRGQIPITEKDFLFITEIVSSYETLSIEKNRRGQDVIIYSKTYEDGVVFYVEEIRQGRHELAASTMYKKKKG